MHTRPLLGLATGLTLLLSACNTQFGLNERGYGYPVELSTYAPRLGGSANFIYYPRYEAYYHPATKEFYYPDGKEWKVQPTVLSNTAKDILATPSVPFKFPDHPSKYHAMVKQTYTPDWTTGKGRYDEPYAFGRSGWDVDRR